MTACTGLDPVGRPPVPATRPVRSDGWALTVASVLCRGYLFTMAGLMLWALLPVLLGWQSTVVSSGSMSPLLPVGSILVTSPTEPAALRIGHVLLFDDPAVAGRLVAHRMVGVDGEGKLLTRGDANGSDDSSRVPTSSVHGVGRLMVPAVGLPVLWARTGALWPLAAWALLTAGAVAVVRRTRVTAWRAARRGGGVRGRRSRRRAPLEATVVVVVALALAGFQHGRPVALATASAAFDASTTNPANSFAADPDAQYGPSAYAAAVAADGPTLFWKLDEAAGPTATNSGTAGAAADGSYSTSGVEYSVDDATVREPASAVRLDGNTGCIIGKQRVDDPQTYTLEVWFRTTSTRGGRLIGFGNLPSGDSQVYDRHVYLTDAGRIVFGIYPYYVVTISTVAAYNDGSWHLATATAGAAGMSLYVDGALVATRADQTMSQPSDGYWRVGCDTVRGWPDAPTSNFFNGSVDNAAIYPTQLTAARVAEHWFAA